MSRAREIAQTALMVVLWVIGIMCLVWLLVGCEGLQKKDLREGAFRVNADCDNDTISVEFELDQHAKDTELKVQR